MNARLSKEIKEIKTETIEQEVITNSHGITCHKTKWGWVATSYEDYLSLKVLHKEVWEVYFAWCKEHEHPALDKWTDDLYRGFPHYAKNREEDGSFEFLRSTVSSNMTYSARVVVDAFREARTVYSDPELIIELEYDPEDVKKIIATS